MRTISVVGVLVVLLLGALPSTAEAGALRWVAGKTWQCPVIKGAATGALKVAQVALAGGKAVAGVVY